MKTKITHKKVAYVILIFLLTCIFAIWITAGISAYNRQHSFIAKPIPKQIVKPAPKQTLVHQKCPDEYANNYAGEVEYQNAFIKWTFDTNSGTTYSDQLAARHQFLIDNNCVAALQRYDEAEKNNMEPVSMWSIEREDNESIDYIELTPDLHKICPFYEPDGSYYRNCVISQLDKERAKFDLESKTYKEIDSYCEYNAVKGADWYTLGFIDNYNACIFYKLKQIK